MISRLALLAVASCCLGAAPALGAISFPELLNSFDVLQTVAGTAQVTGGGVNGWQASMEDQPAIAAELSRPHMTMADWQGNLFIADKDAHAIRKITPDGRIQTVAGTNAPGYNGDGPGSDVELNQPNGLFTFPNGTTYLLDLGNSLIRKLALDGEVTTVVEDPFGILAGRGLWVSPDESTIFYSSGTEIRRWTADEGVTVYASGFQELGNLAVDPADGNVVATDRAGDGVYRVFPDGTSILIAGNETASGGGGGYPALETGLNEVRGIQFHPDGGYLLATHRGGQVWFVDEDEVIHLLIDGDADNDTHGGDGLPLSAPGKKISEPRAVTLAPNGDLIVTEHDGGYIRLARALDPWQMGDFDQDRLLDGRDIDELTQAVRTGHHPQTLDLNFDARVDDQDRDVWVEQLKGTYFGDSDLDGEFSSADLVQVFQRGQYEDEVADNSGWGDGDWNGDGDFDTQDFVLAFQRGGYELGPRPTATWVPEPSGGSMRVLASAGTVLLAARRRRLRWLDRLRVNVP